MNPGYAGRTEIPCPEKLVTIPMTVPDRQAIMGGMLSIEGFLQFENLAEYVARLLKECELYLSKQCVYDFGLRMFKAIGKTAGGLLKSCEATKSEMHAVKDAILVNIVPRLTDQDGEIFKQMVENYFPKIDSNLPNCKQDWMRHTFEIRHAAFAFGEEAAALKLNMRLLTVFTDFLLKVTSKNGLQEHFPNLSKRLLPLTRKLSSALPDWMLLQT